MWRALHNNIATRLESTRIVRENSTSTIIKIAENPCAAVAFVIRFIDEHHLHRTIATRRDGSKTRRANSESSYLAIKKFLCFSRFLLIAPRQSQFFERIAGTDSPPVLARVMRHCETQTSPQRCD